MLKRIIIFGILTLVALPVFAKNKVTLRVSCVIPPRIQLKQAEQQRKDILVYTEEQIRGNRRVLVKTVVSK